MPSSKDSRIAALPAHMQELLRRRLAGQTTQSDAIPPADRTEPLPLSFSQQRLWFLHEFQPGDSAYNSGLAVRLRGPLQVQALTSALQELTLRHESLRTTFDEVDGRGIQVVHAAIDITLPVVELAGYCLLPVGLVLGVVAAGPAVSFLLISVGAGCVLSISALLVEQISLHR